ncbi:MAG: glycerate kinase, partial [Verrucomicrobiia bacterium]
MSRPARKSHRLTTPRHPKLHSGEISGLVRDTHNLIRSETGERDSLVMQVLIAPDKFKGTLDASEAAEAIARGWLKQRPNDQVDIFPISDGGDGFGE